MLTKIINFSVDNKLIVGLMVIGLILFGSYELTKLPIDAVPDITDNQVQVITTAPALGATDIERLITFPIEQAASNIAGIKQIRSFSRFGLSLVTIVFEEGVDVYWARQQVSERLQQVQAEIPQDAGTPEMGPITTGLGEIFQYVVKPLPGYENKYDVTELRTIQDWIVRRQLLGVEGVAEVSSFGGKLKQYEVAVNPAQLSAYGISIQDVFDALSKNNQNTGGAYIEKGPTVLYIKSEGLIGKIQDIENISIRNDGGIPLRIKDIGQVKIGNAIRYGALAYNDEGEVAGAIVMMLKGENSNIVIKNVKERIAQIQKSLPEGVTIEAFLDRTKMVNNAIDTVTTNLMEGALIVVFVLVLFLGNLRAGFIVASVIPLSMLFAIIMMNLFGVSGNLMSLGALDFGLIVDGAVIIVESVMHHLRSNDKLGLKKYLTKREMNEEVKHSASQMMNSAVFGQIIILIVYIPILTLQGIEGKMFRPMAQTVVFALLGAFILSLTYIPMMSSLVLSRKIKTKKNISDRVMEKVENGYVKTLSFILRHSRKTIASITILFAAAIFVASGLGGEFIPQLEEGDFAVDTRVLTGSSLETTLEYTQKAAHILVSRFPEVEKVVTKIGSGEVPTDPMPMEACDMMVILKNKKEWTSAKSFNELAEKMTEAVTEIPGITVSFQYPVQMRFNELMTGARQDVVCKIFGENLDSLSVAANDIAKIIRDIDGTTGLYVETVTGMPQLTIDYNREMLAQYNLNIYDVNQVVNMSFAGQSTGMVYEDEKRFDLVVRFDETQKKDLSNIQNLLISLPGGGQVPLRQIANVQVIDGPNQIQREDAKRRITVGFNARGRDVKSIVDELQQKVDVDLKLPVGYYVTYGGTYENLSHAMARLSIVVPIALLLILLLLYFAFRSIIESLLIYTAIPLSAIGGIFMLYFRGMPFSISAAVGFIALFGIAVLNGVVLISEFNRLKKSGMKNVLRIVLKGTETRLRPVLMTASVASFGFLPMALSTGSGAEVQRPLASVVIGGLISATFLTLFLLPILYILTEKILERFEARKANKKLNKKLIATTLALFVSVCGLAQNSPQAIDLLSAEKIAIENNLFLQNERLKSEYSKTLIRTGADIPSTDISAEMGEINGSKFDTKFGISQTISFPTVYKRQKELLSEQWKSALLNEKLQEADIVRNLQDIFYTYIYYTAKEKLLQESDSIYVQLINRASVRYDAGETNILEKSTFESQRTVILSQLKLINAAKQNVQNQFNVLLNDSIEYYPYADEIMMETTLNGFEIENHPTLQILQQEKLVAEAQTKAEKSKRMPNLSAGYYNGSFRDELHDGSDRFHSFMVGVGIPLFARSVKARIEAGKKYEEIIEKSFEIQKQNLETQLNSAAYLVNQNMEIVDDYRDTALENAKLILKVAEIQFYAGEINFMELSMLINQTIGIQNEYLDAVQTLNQSIIQLNYITSNSK